MILVAESADGGIVGFTQLYPAFCSVLADRTFVLYDLFVAPAARGTGAGRALMEAAESYARAEGAARLELQTARTNVVGQSLYESCGWKRDELFHVYAKGLRGDSGGPRPRRTAGRSNPAGFAWSNTAADTLRDREERFAVVGGAPLPGSGAQMAGDAGLFVLLFGVPALLLAIVFAAVALKAPRGGAVLCGLLLASVAPLLFGVDRVSYMKGAGIWLKGGGGRGIGLVIPFVGLVRHPRNAADAGQDG